MTAGQLVTVLVIVIFLIIVFWRIAIPLLAAFVLAKVVVAVMSTMAAMQGAGAPAAAVFLPLLM
ncbi:MAG TPA: hypothetical protein VGH76_10650 [Actinomycetospora sp.]